MTGEPIDSTMMKEWADCSLKFSAAKKVLLDEFGFENEKIIKGYIRRLFSDKYLDICAKQNSKVTIKWSDFPDKWKITADYFSAIDFAKAILAASALLETTDITSIIEWANVE